jgi:predicted GNAT family acetyltransferase
MTTDPGDADVVDVTDEDRFVIRGDDGLEAELIYRAHGDRLVLIHTEVPEEWGGRGIGGRLVRAALQRARTQHLTVVPWCPFANRWLRDHPDAAAGVTIDWDTPPPS